ncbi:MAG: hypothetical protein GY750_18555 [Lentisphaerae bacterium]|nr:hypothetical protein [Lentisphaerota bacterium]MCP4103400.1 hypothetical protein [Lentisphaerota bacterium]
MGVSRKDIAFKIIEFVEKPQISDGFFRKSMHLKSLEDRELVELFIFFRSLSFREPLQKVKLNLNFLDQIMSKDGANRFWPSRIWEARQVSYKKVLFSGDKTAPDLDAVLLIYLREGDSSQ